MLTKTKSLFGFILLFRFAISIQQSGLLAQIDNDLMNLRFRILWNSTPQIDRKVVVVGIDEETVKQFPEPMALWHPHLGDFFSAMPVAKPKVIGLDVVLPDRSYDFLSPGYDRRLLARILDLRGKVPLYLAQTLNEKGRIRPLFSPIAALVGKERIGLALIRGDNDGHIRRFVPTLGAEKGNLQTLAGLLIQELGLDSYGGGDRFLLWGSI